MRYISEFEITKDEKLFMNSKIFSLKKDHMKKEAEFKIGHMIGEINGFEEVDTNNQMTERYRIEIEAFSRQDWIKFKTLMRYYIDPTSEVWRLIIELEEKGIEKSKELNQRIFLE